ncbi:1-alkyl-2-acetylglycerophosphocholine esterase [Malassezia pachydermatis]|uniref:1-alkyl-2-acetylglycerophosphocholine esterase n=1 Tax=Malassezia pachydermatis TaxID=77020 RepID=A0A0M8MTM9_9BASI|nr:platelet-activating factor acetylhydrolase [Malassezia pachydermatis]KOS14114.1 platelet-activating factor acetylhydrolase [Malassezia pachydermatis]
MQLPKPTGPYDVGIVDVEVPVREPRDFLPDFLSRSELNKLSKNGTKLSDKKAKKVYRQFDASVDRSQEDFNEAIAEDEFLKEHGYRLRSSTLHFRTVLFSLYYPGASLSPDKLKKYKQAKWLGYPLKKTTKAAWAYLGEYGWYARAFFPVLFTFMKAHLAGRVGLPLGDPSKQPALPGTDLDGITENSLSKQTFPVIVFCHGLAGNRLAYSEFCTELASYGFIVAAIEHRDGSGLGTFVWSGVESIMRSSKVDQDDLNARLRKNMKFGGNESVHSLALQDGDTREVLRDESLFQDFSKVAYLPFERLGLQPFFAEQGEKEITLRQAQLKMRGEEIKEVMYVLGRINDGDSEWLARVRTRSMGSSLAGRKTFKRMREQGLVPRCREFFANWKGKMDLTTHSLIGHSFGGATIFEFLRTDQNIFPYGIILDPWMEPVLDPRDNPDVRKKLKRPVYVINSEGFTMWPEQYVKLRRILVDAMSANPEHRGWLMTLTGTNHGDFSDLPYLLPRIFGSAIPGTESVRSFAIISMAQIKAWRQRYALDKNAFHLMVSEGPDAPDMAPTSLWGGGARILADKEAPVTDEMMNFFYQVRVLSKKFHHKPHKPLFWELRGWKQHAQNDPSTRAGRKHLREQERVLHRHRRASSVVHEHISNVLDTDNASNKSGAEFIDEKNGQTPRFIDPRQGGKEVWDGQIIDTDAQNVYQTWADNISIKDTRRRPLSLFTVFMWILGVRQGLAAPGHLLVHEF